MKLYQNIDNSLLLPYLTGFELNITLKMIVLLIVIFPSILMAHTKLNIKIKYNETADLFNFIDNLSGWHRNLSTTKSSYINFLNKNSKTKIDDDIILKRYATVRKKYFKENAASYFSVKDPDEDFVAQIMYKSTSFSESYDKLKLKLSLEDIKIIELTFNHFHARFRRHFKSQHQPIIDYLNTMLSHDTVISFLEKMANFYGVETDKIYLTILIVGIPSSFNTHGLNIQDVILIYNPLVTSNNSKQLSLLSASKIVIHEIAHYFSSLMPNSKKAKLTSILQKNFKYTKKFESNHLDLIEEPLAVIFGQLLFQKYLIPNSFNYYASLYDDAWIKTLARLNMNQVIDYIESKKTIDEHFIVLYSELANQVIEAAHL